MDLFRQNKSAEAPREGTNNGVGCSQLGRGMPQAPQPPLSRLEAPLPRWRGFSVGPPLGPDRCGMLAVLRDIALAAMFAGIGEDRRIVNFIKRQGRSIGERSRSPNSTNVFRTPLRFDFDFCRWLGWKL